MNRQERTDVELVQAVLAGKLFEFACQNSLPIWLSVMKSWYSVFY